jgi:hypothetical protein
VLATCVLAVIAPRPVPAAVAETVLICLRSRSPAVRIAALYCLGRLFKDTDEPAVLQAVTSAARSRLGKVRVAAIATLTPTTRSRPRRSADPVALV